MFIWALGGCRFRIALAWFGVGGARRQSWNWPPAGSSQPLAQMSSCFKRVAFEWGLGVKSLTCEILFRQLLGHCWVVYFIPQPSVDHLSVKHARAGGKCGTWDKNEQS